MDNLNGVGPAINAAHRDIEQIYRAVADGKPREDVLTMIYDLFGAGSNLRPPSAEIRLADRVRAGGGVANG